MKIKKGDFLATVKIYGQKKLIGEYYDVFETENEHLSKKDLREIEEFIVNKSNVPEEKIVFTTIRISQDDLL